MATGYERHAEKHGRWRGNDVLFDPHASTYGRWRPKPGISPSYAAHKATQERGRRCRAARAAADLAATSALAWLERRGDTVALP
jgi:hypothetical protein